ncbi:mechanosensitive ion channel family protein [Enterovirga rhinocerotis]|uniref:Small-conductance mechanosensitive channel n=1 Tax=Enterovirga rhinocerotis TaxID=1339210 RepID=A0A4V3DXV0_9HYPH|nr:mechanosensitive ion channel family protein [Enterovirga rhinocerotis]TDR89909.1 small-conductance mechanosensitive channel [Enterovirga rhinocerotis]
MAASSSGSADASGFVDQMSRFFGTLETALTARLERLSALPGEISALARTVGTGGVTSHLFAASVAVIAVSLSFWLAGRMLTARGRPQPWLLALATAIIGAAWAIVLGALMGSEVEAAVARIWAVSTAGALILATVIRAVIVQDESQTDQRRIGNGHVVVATFALMAVTVQATLRLMNAGPGLHDAVSLAVGLTVTISLCLGYILNRHAVRNALLHGRTTSVMEGRLAAAWPWIAAALVATTFVLLQIAATLTGPLPGLAVLASVLFLLLSPHLDQIIALKAEAIDGEGSIFRQAARRTARSAFWFFVVCSLGVLWLSPLSVAIGLPRGLIIIRALDVAVLALAAIYLWHLVGALAERTVVVAKRPGEEPHRPATRLATLAPLITLFAQVAIVSLAALSILIALGVNAWPFVAGLSVFGLAIGFGSQSLVKDIVSGVFFLLDDAFRFGEYIETSQAKGTVERISIRSVALRHPRGALATIPYGSIGKVVNYSRDWVIDKLAFRVAFDTDPTVVRKLFKKIGQEIAADPTLGPDMLQPFKSQGVFAVDDGTLVIRAKFMARAGHQFMIRKAILAAVHKGFRENGIVPVAKFPLQSSN